jgi:hypothetical protein
MRSASFISCAALLLAGSIGWGAEPAELPTRIASSGKVLAVKLSGAVDTPVRLRALGRNWTEPITPHDGSIEVELPPVRVPTVFSVVAAEKTEPALAQIVVYPADYHLAWDKQVLLSHDADSPAWFKEWLSATGLPATSVKLGDFPVGDARIAGGAGLLLVGRSGAGKSAGEFVERHAHWQINVLVLEADWFGEKSNDEVHLPAGTDSFHHGLAELKRFTWPQSLLFRNVAGPWPGIANRWVWIDGPTAPLLEEFRASTNSRRIVFSYLPWFQQLGIETADAILLSVLKEAARKRSAEEMLDREFHLVWPAGDSVSAATRPVLAACLRAQEARQEGASSGQESEPPQASARRPSLSILDLRGPALSTSDAAALPVVSREQDWLVLGSDPEVMIPDPEQPAELSGHGPAKKDRVIRLTEDALPPSVKGQVRLMQVLTDQGVFIGKLKP